MTTLDELVAAIASRYAGSGRLEKGRILDEFVAVTKMHRKHAQRLLRQGKPRQRSAPRPGRRIYDEAVREALILVWESSDRICGKRLKSLVPILIEAMERHGHLRLADEVRSGLLSMSAATIDRSLREVRERAGGRKAAPGGRVGFPAPKRAGENILGLARSPTGVLRGRLGRSQRSAGKWQLYPNLGAH